MRVAVVTENFAVPSETFITNQVLGLMARGFDVSFVCDRVARNTALDLGSEPFRTLRQRLRLRRWQVPERLGALVNRLPAGLKGRLWSAAHLLSDSGLNDFDVLVCHFAWNGLRLGRARRYGLLRRPFVTFFHGVDIGVPFRRGELASGYMPTLRHCDRLLPANAYFRDMLLRSGADPARVAVQRVGVDCEAIAFAPRPSRDAAGMRILSVGRLVEKKGLEYVIRALALLRGRRPELDWSYEIVGEGVLRPELERLAQELGVAERVRLLGAMPNDEVQRRLRQANLFVLPSVLAGSGDLEACPVALQEAMAMGTPVVSSLHAGIPELIEHGRSGLLAPERDAETLMRHLEWMADNPEGGLAMARAARTKVEAEFNARLLDDRLAGLLREVAAEGDAGARA